MSNNKETMGSKRPKTIFDSNTKIKHIKLNLKIQQPTKYLHM